MTARDHCQNISCAFPQNAKRMALFHPHSLKKTVGTIQYNQFYTAKHALVQFEIHPKESRFHGLTF